MVGKELVDKAICLYKHTPFGEIVDGDTVLCDLYDEYGKPDIGTFCEVVDIWEHSTDRESIEDLFETLLGVTFGEYIDRCIKETTQPENHGQGNMK